MPQAVRIEWSTREAWLLYTRRQLQSWRRQLVRRLEYHISASDIAFSFNLTYIEPVDMHSAPPTHWHLQHVYVPLQEVQTPTSAQCPRELPVSCRVFQQASELEASQPGSPVPVPPSPTVFAPTENYGQKLQTACSKDTIFCSGKEAMVAASGTQTRTKSSTRILFRSRCDRELCWHAAGSVQRKMGLLFPPGKGCKATGTRSQARAPWHVQTFAIVLTRLRRLLPSEVPRSATARWNPLWGKSCGALQRVRKPPTTPYQSPPACYVHSYFVRAFVEFHQRRLHRHRRRCQWWRFLDVIGFQLMQALHGITRE